MKTIEVLLKELDKAWNSSEDERFKGENPACDRIQDEIEKKFNNLSDEELKEILQSIQEDKLEQIAFVLESIADNRSFVEKFIRQ